MQTVMMATAHMSVISLDGPLNTHLYIGHCAANINLVKKVRKQLETFGVACRPRYYLTSDVMLKSYIDEGVRCSKKCMLVLSPEYLQDDYYRIERNAVLDKASRFSRDVLMLLVTDSTVTVPKKLAGHTTFSVADMDKPHFVQELAAKIMADINSFLAVLPKANMGYGSALGFYYGYLRLVLPQFTERLLNETMKMQTPSIIRNTVHRMLIVMPESCFSPTSMVEEGKIESANMWVNRKANRAGNLMRDYKSTVYKLIDDKKEEYYFALELATPLLTMYESYCFGLAHMTLDQLNQERDTFYFTLKAILEHPENRECNDQCRIVYWNDPGIINGTLRADPNKLDLYTFLLPLLKAELAIQASEPTQEKQSCDYNGATATGHNTAQWTGPFGTIEKDDCGNGLLSPSRTSVESSLASSVDSAMVQKQRTLGYDVLPNVGPNPGANYDLNVLNCYNMVHTPRGLCMIINIANFTKESKLSQRKGSEADVDKMKMLFSDLYFEVEVHPDPGYEALERLMITANLKDHSDYDAFVVVIMTHGKLGVVYTTDGKPVRILDLVSFFTDVNCHSLKGKPKMFFIQACQKGDLQQDSAATLQTDNGAAASATADMETLCIGDGANDLEEDANIVPTFTSNCSQDQEIRATLVPGHPDFLMSYSTLPGTISYRDVNFGSLYVQALDKSLRMGGEMDRMLKHVTKNVKELLGQHNRRDGHVTRKQLPFHLTSGMDKLIYL